MVSPRRNLTVLLFVSQTILSPVLSVFYTNSPKSEYPRLGKRYMGISDVLRGQIKNVDRTSNQQHKHYLLNLGPNSRLSALTKTQKYGDMEFQKADLHDFDDSADQLLEKLLASNLKKINSQLDKYYSVNKFNNPSDQSFSENGVAPGKSGYYHGFS